MSNLSELTVEQVMEYFARGSSLVQMATFQERLDAMRRDERVGNEMMKEAVVEIGRRIAETGQ